MHFAIIAAGEGSRLREEGVSAPKPLVSIQGQPMVDRLMTIMAKCHAESISVICNSAMTDVCEHLKHCQPGPELRIISSQTPSSMHSLALLSKVIPEGKVIVTTVDTIFREHDFVAYVEAFEQADGALFAVTPFVDDEKPLWISVEETETALYPRITAFCDARPTAGKPMVSGGIYGLDTRTAWPILHRCISEGQSRMRNYQRALLSAGVTVRACVFGHIMDIDHASDITKANQWLAKAKCIALVSRSPEHSPNNVAKDRAILDAVADELKCHGLEVETFAEETLGQHLQADVVLHMARRLSALSRLAQLKARVVNNPRSVMNIAHSREYILSLLHEAGIRVPAWWSYDPEEDEMFQCEPRLQSMLPAWVKATRTDGARPDDVVWVETPLEADSRILEFASQQVPDIVVTSHVEGDLIKVYCVIPGNGTEPFVRMFYPQEMGYSKFGMAEQHNSPLAHYPITPDCIERLSKSIAETLQLEIFGYDAIVGCDGEPVVIDVNDWPSFSLCREEAAEAICQLVIENS